MKPLTYDQLMANEPCPGCGRRWYGDAEDNESFKQQHAECRGGWQSMEHGENVHCIKCCPYPPLSPAQVSKVATLLRGYA